MKRFTLVILAFFLLLINSFAYGAQNYTKKELSVLTKDNFNLKASLTYPKIKGQRDYKTVVLLHSFGSNSTWWGSLPNSLLENGYAVLTIDMRGHGKSVYNAKLSKVSWKSLTNNAFKKYPDDVVSVVEYVKSEYPKMHFFNEWAIVGSDIGASAGVIAADKLKEKPETIVMLSPVVQSRGLYIPVSIAQLDNTDFLSISCESDSSAAEAEKYLRKFAQKEFKVFTSKTNGTGMIILKNDPDVVPLITEWIKEYFDN